MGIVSHIFISYSRKDAAIARAIADSLAEADFSAWFDFDDLEPGQRWVQVIQQAVEECDAMVVVMSRAARDSEWVERETLLAMDLKKPLHVVLIEDIPLPLHLINRQYIDFRDESEAARKRALRKLTAALRRLPRRLPKAMSPEPDRDNFFKYLDQLPGGSENVAAARDLFGWAKGIADRVEFGGQATPGYHARVYLGEMGDDEVTVFSVWAYPRQPALQVQFQYLRDYAPYDSERRRQSALDDLNALLPDSEQIPPDRASKRPTIALHTLADDATRARFKAALEGIIGDLKGE
jgi:hypothetical protein